MDTILTFITVLAWIGAVGGTLLAAAFGYMSNQYHHGGKDGGPSLEKLLDRMNGVQSVFPVKKYMTVALVSWAWVIATFV